MFFSFLLLAGAWVAGCAKPAGQGEFDAGLREIKRGNYVRAKTLLEKSILLRPGSEQNAVAYYYLGLVASNLGQYQAAIEAFEDSRRLSPALSEPVYNLGVLAADTDVPRAIKLLEEAARINAADPRPLEFLGHLYAARRQWPDARRSLYAALDRAPHSPRIWTRIALVDLQADGPEKAIGSLMNALERDARYAPALFNLAVINQFSLQNAQQAEGYFRKFLEVAGGSPQAAYASNMLAQIRAAASPAPEEPERDPLPSVATPAAPRAKTPDDLLKDAARFAEQGQSQRALDICLQVANEAAAARNTDLQEKALRAAVRLCFDQPRAHVELGRFLLDRKKADAAYKLFKQAIVLDRNNAQAHLGMAQAAIQIGEFDAALVGLKDAVKIDPRNADALWSLALLYDQQLDVPSGALNAYRDFERLFPSDPRVIAARDRIQKLSAAPRAAPAAPAASTRTEPAPATAATQARRIQYKKPSVRNTKDAVSAFTRGNEYQQQKNWDQAIHYYLRAIENDDLLTSAFFNLGIAYSAKGDYDLAKDAYLRVLALQPNMVDARYNLALIYREQNDPVPALHMLREVVRIKPDHAPAHYALGVMYAGNESTVALAKQHYQRYLELAPNDPAARSVRQWISTH